MKWWFNFEWVKSRKVAKVVTVGNAMYGSSGIFIIIIVTVIICARRKQQQHQTAGKKTQLHPKSGESCISTETNQISPSYYYYPLLLLFPATNTLCNNIFLDIRIIGVSWVHLLCSILPLQLPCGIIISIITRGIFLLLLWLKCSWRRRRPRRRRVLYSYFSSIISKPSCISTPVTLLTLFPYICWIIIVILFSNISSSNHNNHHYPHHKYHHHQQHPHLLLLHKFQYECVF